MNLTVEKAKRWILNYNHELQENKLYLTELDQAIGDGDHGLNMARGFHEAAAKINSADYKDLGTLFKDVGMTLISKVGGASGPLYGTAFMRLSMSLKEKNEAGISELSEALEAALEGLKMRGKAQARDKTMIDVWEPVLQFMKDNKGITGQQLADYAKERMEATIEMEARKGRAAYLGKRSVGHIDPGAASSYILFRSLGHVFSEGEF